MAMFGDEDARGRTKTSGRCPLRCLGRAHRRSNPFAQDPAVVNERRLASLDAEVRALYRPDFGRPSIPARNG